MAGFAPPSRGGRSLHGVVVIGALLNVVSADGQRESCVRVSQLSGVNTLLRVRPERILEAARPFGRRVSSSCGLGELRGEALDPPEDRDMVDLDPALGQQFLDVPVGEAEPQVQADGQGDDFGWERCPA